jgi:hypothetical protein
MRPIARITLKTWLGAIFLAAGMLLQASRAFAQSGPVFQSMAPLGYCQLTAAQLAASIGLASCVRASFTGTGSGTNLTTTSVTGIIKSGDTVAGTGVPAGTTIISQTSGTAGGAGVYVTSVATTSSGASLTSGGIPSGASIVLLQATSQDISYRDDGGAPTATIGMILHGGGGSAVTNFPPTPYLGPLGALRFIAISGSPILNVSFYR